MLDVEKMFGANRDSPCVKLIYGLSGSGKTMFLCESARVAARSPNFTGLHRFVIFDVKHDGYQTLAKPVETVEEAINKLKPDRVVVIHPDIQSAKIELDRIISYLFDMAELNPDFSATFILEESSTFIGSSVGSIPASVKRFATQGRSKGLSMLIVNQRALSNKWVDSQAQGMTIFRLPLPDAEMLKKRWGLDFEEIDSELKQIKFSFAYYDLESLELSYYNPIEIPDLRIPIVKPKKNQWKNLFKLGGI